MGVTINGKEIFLSGTVGGQFWDEDGFSATDVYRFLLGVGRKANITVRLNSGGGAADEGTAIYSMLSAHEGDVKLIVEGIAASAASAIAMAGDTIIMGAGAVMMLHDPWGISIGNVDEMDSTRRGLEATTQEYAGIYARRSGKTVAECRKLMKEEAWYTGSEAVEEGFADAVAAGARTDPSPFAVSQYQRVPASIQAMARAQHWPERNSGKAGWKRVARRVNGESTPSVASGYWRYLAIGLSDEIGVQRVGTGSALRNGEVGEAGWKRVAGRLNASR